MNRKTILKMQLENARKKLDICCAMLADGLIAKETLETIWQRMAEIDLLLKGADQGIFDWIAALLPKTKPA